MSDISKVFSIDLPECETDYRYVRVCFGSGRTDVLTLDAKVRELRIPLPTGETVVQVETGVCDDSKSDGIEWLDLDLKPKTTTTTTTAAPTTTTTTTTTTLAPVPDDDPTELSEKDEASE